MTIVALGGGETYEVACSYSTFVRRWRRALLTGEWLYLQYAPLTYANPHQIVCAMEAR